MQLLERGEPSAVARPLADDFARAGVHEHVVLELIGLGDPYLHGGDAIGAGLAAVDPHVVHVARRMRRTRVVRHDVERHALAASRHREQIAIDHPLELRPVRDQDAGDGHEQEHETDREPGPAVHPQQHAAQAGTDASPGRRGGVVRALVSGCRKSKSFHGSPMSGEYRRWTSTL